MRVVVVEEVRQVRDLLGGKQEAVVLVLVRQGRRRTAYLFHRLLERP